VAVLTAIVARRGRMMAPPHLLLADGPPEDGGAASSAGDEPQFKASEFESVIAGMWKSANDGGTGKGARVEGFDVCGKTGSTQTMSRESAAALKRAGREIKTHSWFSGFAPRVDPKIVVTVLVEFGGGGGATAAPVAQRIFEAFKRELEAK
jgi:penicillin-binding protein 2